MLPIQRLFWILGAMCLGAGLTCLYFKPTMQRALLLSWLATTLAACGFAYYWNGGHNFNGYLGNLSYAFGVPVKSANMMMEFILACLMIGTYSFFPLFWLQKVPARGDASLKIHCAACGGKIRFSDRQLGHVIPCPHCQKNISLRRPENLKMSCFFCREHIEFPPHAIGEKMPCPHCDEDITLKETV